MLFPSRFSHVQHGQAECFHRVAGSLMGAICNALSIIFLGLLRDDSHHTHGISGKVRPHTYPNMTAGAVWTFWDPWSARALCINTLSFLRCGPCPWVRLQQCLPQLHQHACPCVCSVWATTHRAPPRCKRPGDACNGAVGRLAMRCLSQPVKSH